MRYESNYHSDQPLLVLSFQESSSTAQHHVSISIEELSATLEGADAKEEPAEEKGECRYCQEEEVVSKLEAPCNCNGTLKYAHRKCVAHWCNIKRNIECEICKQPYSPNYSVTGPPPNNDEDDILRSERWRVPGTNIQILTPMQLTEIGTNRLIRSMNTDFSLRNPTVGVVIGTALLIFLAVMVIRDACYYTPPKDDQYSHLLYIGVVIIVLPIYILSWIMEFRAQLQRNREMEMEMERAREMEMEMERDLTG